MKILSRARIRVFDDTPTLSSDEALGFSAMDIKTRRITNQMRSDVNKVGFLTQRAYFQAKGRFFSPSKFKPAHIRMATRSLGIKRSVNLNDYNPKTASHHRGIILELYGWKPYEPGDRTALEQHALLLADKQKDSESILFSLLDFCWKNKTEVPGYNEFVDIISKAFIAFEDTMRERVASNVTNEQMLALISLIENTEITNQFSEIKRINQATTQHKLNYNANVLKHFKEVFFVILPLLDSLSLTSEAIKHLSEQVHKSTLSQLRGIKDVNKKCLMLAAFVQDQYFLRQDYAVDAFLKFIRGLLNQAKKHDESLKRKDEKDLHEANQSILNSAKNSTQILKLILNVSKDPNINLAEKNEKVLYLAESYFMAEDPDLMSHIGRLESNIDNFDLNINLHQFLFKESHKLQRLFSPIIRLLEFDALNSSKEIIEAIQFFKDGIDVISDDTPTGFLSKKDKNVVLAENEIPKISRYKVKLFIAIEKAIRRKCLTLKYSYRYKASHTYMISDEQWHSRKSEFIKAAGLEKYIDGRSVLNKMGKSLTDTYIKVNHRYLAGGNDYLTVDDRGSWRIRKSEPKFDTTKYIPELLSDVKPVLLYELLSEVDSYTGFTDIFSHHSIKHSKKEIEKKLIFATLMSLGTNLGHNDLARASRGIKEKQMRDTEKLWFTKDSLLKANRRIVETIQELPLPTIFNDQGNMMHTSSDGKKVVVAVNSLLANYSYKYYGKEQGVTVNSFLDEKQSFFHVNVMTSSDREAPYMMDGLVKSASSFRESSLGYVDEHMHSTDTHGYTEAIFAGLHFLDVSFAPRIANLAQQVIYAYEAKSLRKNTKNPIAPKSVINKKLILDNWDNILRLMATIKLNYCSASLMFRMLSASANDGPLYSAIKEFGRLIKSKFILNYIDDEELRRSITKQLNKAELGQKLGRAVFYGRAGYLQIGTSAEIQRVMMCKTILQNVIILWNYLFLSDYYNELSSKEERRTVSEMISKGSVIAWKHINMMGIFDFDHDVPHSFKSSIKQMMELKMVDWEDSELVIT